MRVHPYPHLDGTRLTGAGVFEPHHLGPAKQGTALLKPEHYAGTARTDTLRRAGFAAAFPGLPDAIAAAGAARS